MHALQAAYSIAHFCKAIWAKVSSEKTSDSDYCNVLPGKRDTGVERRLIIQRQPIQRFQVSETEAHWATANIKIQQKQWIRYAEKKVNTLKYYMQRLLQILPPNTSLKKSICPTEQ